MGPAPVVRRVAPAASTAEAAARLWQAAYGCTMHSAGLLHALAAVLDAEAEGRFTLAQVAAEVGNRAAEAARLASPSDAWRYAVIGDLMDRLCASSR